MVHRATAHENLWREPREASTQTADDWVLLARVRAGDEQAFATLFRIYIGGLLGFAEHYVRSAAVAEELVADVFLNIWINRTTFTPTGSVASYLYTAVRNRCLRSLDRDRRARVWEGDVMAGDRLPGVSTVAANADTRSLTGNVAEITARVLAALPARAREVFLLYRQHDLSYAEIGSVLGISVRTVEGHMARAMTAFRAALADFL